MMTFRYPCFPLYLCKSEREKVCLVSRRLQLPYVKDKFLGVDQSIGRPYPTGPFSDPTPQEAHRLLLQVGRTTRTPDAGLDLLAALVEGLWRVYVSFVAAHLA